MYIEDIVKKVSILDKLPIDDHENRFNEIEKSILNIISEKDVSVDMIKSILKLSDEYIEELLFEMEVNGMIKQSGG